MRTLKPYNVNEEFVPWVHIGEALQAIMYLAGRIGFEEIHALKELHEELYFSLKNLSGSEDRVQVKTEDTKEQ